MKKEPIDFLEENIIGVNMQKIKSHYDFLT